MPGGVSLARLRRAGTLARIVMRGVFWNAFAGVSRWWEGPAWGREHGRLEVKQDR